MGQQDAEEFLTFFLARLNKILHRPPTFQFATCDADLAWEEYLASDGGRIQQIFTFQLRSTVTFPETHELVSDDIF